MGWVGIQIRSMVLTPIRGQKSLTQYIICKYLFIPQDGIYIEPKDVRYLPDGQAVRRPGDDYYPLFDDHSGANYLERETQLLHLVGIPYNIVTPQSILTAF